MTRELNEQWVEVIDGKRHMLKAVPPLSIYDGKSINGRTCHGCSFVDEWDDDCTLKNPPCRISEHKAGPFIIKDLGILNEDGCLPEERTGKYPTIKDRNEYEGWLLLHIWDCIVCEKIGNDDEAIEIRVSALTRQEAIDRWNRRA